MKSRKIVITGISGNIGRILYGGLKDNWEISGIDVKELPDVAVRIADISNIGSIGDAFQDAYAVVHLAANAWGGASWDEVIGPNVTGTYNVFRTAQQAGVCKIIFASSNHITGLYEKDEPYHSIVTGRYEGLKPEEIPRIDHTMPIRPDGYYAASKVVGETLGRYYSEKFDIQVICIRIGSVNRENRPYNVRQYATLFFHNDLIKIVEKCLLNEDIRFEIFYGVSGNTWRFWDTGHIKECLGWEPEENAELLRER